MKNNGSNRNRFAIYMSDTLNRSFVFTSYPQNSPVNIAILFSKKNSALEVQYDTKSPIIVTKNIKVRLHRNLNNCMFASTFFKMENLQNNDYDYMSRFVGLNKKYENILLQSSAEKWDLRTETEYKTKDNSNYIFVSGWNLYDYSLDLLYYLVQRKFFNTITRTTIIRSVGIQLGTDKGFKILQNYYNDYQKHNEEKIINQIPDYLKDVEKTDIVEEVFSA